MKIDYTLEEKEKVLVDWNYVKNHLFITLRPTQKAVWNGFVREEIGPLSLVPRVMLSDDGSNITSAGVVYYLLQVYGITEKEILPLAKNNGEKLYPPHFAEKQDMTTITVEGGPFLYGGAALFYPDVIKKMEEKYNGSFFVVPFSTSKLILVPVTRNPEDLLAALKKANSRPDHVKKEALGNYLLLYAKGNFSVIE